VTPVEIVLFALVGLLVGFLAYGLHVMRGVVRDAYAQLLESHEMSARWLESSAAQQGFEGPDESPLLGYTPIAGGGYLRDDGVMFDENNVRVPLVTEPKVRADG
jgi:hypothetical protein